MKPKEIWKSLSKEEKKEFLFDSKINKIDLTKIGETLFNYAEAKLQDENLKSKLREIYILAEGSTDVKLRLFDPLDKYPLAELIDKGYVFITPSTDLSLNIKYVSISRIGVLAIERFWERIKRIITESKDFTLISISLLSAILNIASTFYVYWSKFNPLIEEATKK